MVKGMLVCIQTDEGRYVLIKILATTERYFGGNQVTYRVESQDPT